ncbi:MAG: hypothetical protein EOP67_63700, partial [Sphingomonas sp.]
RTVPWQARRPARHTGAPRPRCATHRRGDRLPTNDNSSCRTPLSLPRPACDSDRAFRHRNGFAAPRL